MNALPPQPYNYIVCLRYEIHVFLSQFAQLIPVIGVTEIIFGGVQMFRIRNKSQKVTEATILCRMII